MLKKIVAVLKSLARAKRIADHVKGRVNALRIRLMIFYLLRNNNNTNFLSGMTSSVSHKIQNAFALTTGKHTSRNSIIHDDYKKQEDEEEKEDEKAVALYNQVHDLCTNHNFADPDDVTINVNKEEIGDEGRYPNLTHSLFDGFDYDDNNEDVVSGGSVVDMVKKFKQLDEGEEFRLEDEIDHVADLFIERIHRQMRLEKQISLLNHQSNNSQS